MVVLKDGIKGMALMDRRNANKGNQKGLDSSSDQNETFWSRANDQKTMINDQ